MTDLLKKMSVEVLPAQAARSGTLKGQVAENFEEIEELKKKGFSDLQIVEFLQKNGMEVNVKTFRTVMSKIRISRKA
jgi:hypothetical protein